MLMVKMKEFEIFNGVLVKYRGNSDEVTVPDGVVEIGEGCFNKSYMKKAVLPAGVKIIRKDAFINCWNLSAVILPEGLTEIGEGAFAVCKSLTNIEIPDTVVLIGAAAFSHCTKLESIRLPASLSKISSLLFSSCISLAHIDIPANVKIIDYAAFEECRQLESITLPAGLRQLGYAAFAFCGNLAECFLPAGLSGEFENPFIGCKKLNNIHIDKNNTQIFFKDGVLFSENGAKLICCLPCKKGDYVIPDGVKAIVKDAFNGCDELLSVSVPDSVESIGKCAFARCSSIQTVTLPKSIRLISSGCFSGCESLKKLDIPAGVELIDFYAFRNCSSLRQLYIPDSVTDMYFNALEDMSENLTVSLPGNINIIDKPILSSTTTAYFRDLSIAEIPRDCKRNALLGFVKNYQPEKCSEEIKNSYIKYLKSQSRHFLGNMAADIGLLSFALENNVLSAEKREALHLKLLEKGNAEGIAMLLEYNAAAPDAADPLDILEKEMNKDIFAVSEIKKEWRYRKNENGDIVLTGYKGSKTKIVCPNRVGKASVVGIDPWCFSPGGARLSQEQRAARRNIESVTVCEGITSIGKGAFSGCDSLVLLMLPKGIIEIGGSAFNGCGKVLICTPDERLAAALSSRGYTVQIINDVNKENTDETC